MRRRAFVVGGAAAAAAAAGGGLFALQQRLAATVRYPGRAEGHWLRDGRALPEPQAEYSCDVVILGSGIAALMAAWQLAKRSGLEVRCVVGPERFGNAAAAAFGDAAYPTGAHYLPLPSLESVHVRELLDELGVILRDPYGERPEYDERYLLHAPGERVLFEGAWQDGYLPGEGVSGADVAESRRFFETVDAFSVARGADGRRAFVVPLALSSADPRWRALDRLSFSQWLHDAGYRSPVLLWYLDYCCRDDYGRHASEVSAWAGFHYFCGRGGLASNADKGAVLTWPEGLGFLARALAERGRLAERAIAGTALRVALEGDGVRVFGADFATGTARGFVVRARHAIVAMPLYVAAHVVAGFAGYAGAPGSALPAYAPWLVSNFLMRDFPEERQGAGLAWDNIVYREPGLGYVVSTHQAMRRSRPEHTVFSAYHAFSDDDPATARRWLSNADSDALLAVAAADLKLAYGWKLAPCVEAIEITVRGHAMAVPAPGFLEAPLTLALRGAHGPISFAHADLSGLSVFEEAAWWGYQAARALTG